MSTFTDAERDTILAALRLWQVPGILDHVGETRRQMLLDIAEDSDGPLAPTEIDDLCERINCEPEPLPQPTNACAGALSHPIQIACPTCGSPNVTRDALARWNVHTQEWEIADVLDNGTCEADGCGQETKYFTERPATLEELAGPANPRERGQ